MRFPEDFINKIVNCDCANVLRDIPDGGVDLVVTDVPYGVVNRADNGLRSLDKKDADVLPSRFDSLMRQVVKKTKGSIYIFCAREQVSDFLALLEEHNFSTRLIIWEKTNPSPMNGEYIWLSGIECCVYGKLSGATFNGHCENTVLRFPAGKSTDHPTEKNLHLIQKLVQMSSKEGDVVLDPFVGSGTTALACKNLSRKFIGIEINSVYAKLAEDRLRQEVLF